MKSLVADGKFAYSRYDAIGLFRLLELAKATEPAALEKLAESSGLQVRSIHWSPYDRVGVVNADP